MNGDIHYLMSVYRVETLVQMTGASRRTVYYWAHGVKPREPFRTRIRYLAIMTRELQDALPWKQAEAARSLDRDGPLVEAESRDKRE